MQKPHKDHCYITALLEHDSRLIREIYEQFAEPIAKWVKKNNGDENDAGDVFQDALIAITQRARKGGFQLTCPFGAYLFMVCRSKWLNELKKRKQSGVTLSDFDGLKDITDATELAHHTIRIEAQHHLFWEQFQLLGERCQELIKLSLTGISMQEVAQKMDTTYAYARKKKSTCLTRLMTLIKAAPNYFDIMNK